MENKKHEHKKEELKSRHNYKEEHNKDSRLHPKDINTSHPSAKHSIKNQEKQPDSSQKHEHHSHLKRIPSKEQPQNSTKIVTSSQRDERRSHSKGVLSTSKEPPHKKEYAKIIYGNLPEKYRKKLENEAIYAGFELPIYNYVTNIMKTYYTIMFIILTIASFSLNLSQPIIIIIAVIIALTGLITPYILFTVAGEKRTKAMEKVLPDLLILAASNIKSGLTIDKALLFAARDEFGALSDEIKKTAFKIYGGIRLEDAFNDMTDRINSGHLKRTINLLLEGIRSGGNTATLLEESATDIENSKMLQKEINASVQMYIIFIILAGVIAAPIMFAISNYLIENTTGMWGDVDPESASKAGGGILTINPVSSSIDPEFFTFFAAAAITITTVFGGMLISLIKFGNLKHTIKYSPIFTVVALALFFIAKTLVASAMGGL